MGLQIEDSQVWHEPVAVSTAYPISQTAQEVKLKHDKQFTIGQLTQRLLVVLNTVEFGHIQVFI